MAASARTRLAAASGMRSAIARLLRAVVNSAVMNRGVSPVADKCVREPRLSVVPAFPRCAGAVPAAARGKNDEFGVAQQSDVGLRVDRHSWSDEVVDAGLDGAWRAVVVERKAQQDRVSLLDVVDQLNAECE